MNVHQIIRKEAALSEPSHFAQNVSSTQKLLSAVWKTRCHENLLELHQAVLVLSSAFTV